MRFSFLLLGKILAEHGSNDEFETDNPIFNAVKEYDEVGLKKAITDGYDINDNEPGMTPLLLAVMKGYTSVAKILMESGADVSIQNHEGFSTMDAAAMIGNAKLVELLLENGADINGYHSLKNPGKGGHFPIHFACRGHGVEHAEVVQVFLDNGIDPDMENAYGETCLSITSNYEVEDVILDFLDELENQEMLDEEYEEMRDEL